MRKQLLLISVLVLIVSAFVSCSANSSIEDISTTAVTDSNGTTHYYEPVTDDKGNMSTSNNQDIFAEIETQSNGKAVTKKDGTYVTKEHTTVLPAQSVTDSTSIAPEQTAEESTTSSGANNSADNVVEFEPTNKAEGTKADTTSTTAKKSTTTTTTTTTTQKETQPVTDKDGWINKWY